MKDEMLAAGIKPPYIVVKVFNEDAVLILSQLYSEGWEALRVQGDPTRFDFVKEGVLSPHRLVLGARGTWHINAGLTL